MRTALLLILALSLPAADWPQWRGINRDGKSAETGFLKVWPASGPKQLWKAAGLGEGYSSMAVVGNRVYTQGQRDSVEYLIALDAASGKELWRTQNGKSYEERRGNGPRGAPTVEADRVYALAADGSLICANSATGAKIWGFNILERYSGSVPHWGISESPLIDGNRLVVMPGGSKGSVVALDKMTGKEIWKATGEEAAYSSAILAQVGNQRQILHFDSDGAVGVRADTGEPLWRYTQVSNRTANIATPIFRDGHAFFSSDYGTGAALLKLTGGKAEEVYFRRDMKNHYSSSVLVGDHLYGYSSSLLVAMKFLTGEVAWRNRTIGKGSVIYADGMLYCQGENGTIALVEAKPGDYLEKSRFSISKSEYPLWALPVIANGRLYVRDMDSMYSFDLGGK